MMNDFKIILKVKSEEIQLIGFSKSCHKIFHEILHSVEGFYVFTSDLELLWIDFYDVNNLRLFVNTVRIVVFSISIIHHLINFVFSYIC